MPSGGRLQSVFGGLEGVPRADLHHPGLPLDLLPMRHSADCNMVGLGPQPPIPEPMGRPGGNVAGAEVIREESKEKVVFLAKSGFRLLELL